MVYQAEEVDKDQQVSPRAEYATPQPSEVVYASNPREFYRNLPEYTFFDPSYAQFFTEVPRQSIPVNQGQVQQIAERLQLVQQPLAQVPVPSNNARPVEAPKLPETMPKPFVESKAEKVEWNGGGIDKIQEQLKEIPTGNFSPIDGVFNPPQPVTKVTSFEKPPVLMTRDSTTGTQ